MRGRLADRLEVDLLNFDDLNTPLCEELAKAHGMVFKQNAPSGSAHFFKPFH